MNQILAAFPAYQEYARLQLQRHSLLADGQDGSDEMEAIEARMVALWPAFSKDQRKALGRLGSALNRAIRQDL